MRRAHHGDRWKDRRVLAALLGVSVVVFPVACSLGAVLAVQLFVSAPGTVIGFGIWWLGTLAVCTIVFFATERVARRALPFAVLLKMGMAFPGRAPRRLAVARRAGSVRDLHRRVEQARTRGLADEPTVAAEKIVTLAASLSSHDRTTRGHAERVRALTDMIAEELRLPEVHRDRLRWSSLLHDIGKLAVHPDILNKTERLSAEEWEIIRRHPLEGARLTAPIAGWLGPWANTIAEHHERYDGRGYPYGIAGRQISLGGRIVAVADSYDVMTSIRSYKRPMAPDKARQELATCAGSQFDPDVVRAFLAVSVWRLRLAAPVSWFGSLSFGKALGAASRIGTVAGHSVLAGVAAGVGVLGLTALSPLSSVAQATAPSAITAAPVHGQSGTTGNGADSGTSSSRTPSGNGGSGSSGGGTPTEPTKGSTTTVPGPSKGTTTTTAAGKSGTGGNSGSGSGSGSNPGSSGGSGSGGGSGGTPGAPGTTTTTTTTTTTPPRPSPPTGLTVTGGCQVIIVGPELTVSWRASPSSFVTSYTVLRKSGGGGYSTVTQVSATTTSYADTSVSGLGSTYTYEIQANAPGGTATSTAASGTTPPLCL
jgi:hypothetical protein